MDFKKYRIKKELEQLNLPDALWNDPGMFPTPSLSLTHTHTLSLVVPAF